jgi:hypothetical protein
VWPVIAALTTTTLEGASRDGRVAPLPIEQWVDDLEFWNGFPADASSHDGSATPTWQTCTNPPDPP